MIGTAVFSEDEDTVCRVRGAGKIGLEAQRLAAVAGIVPLGVMWDHGERFCGRQTHTLQIFRGAATASVKFSDDELKRYSDGIHRHRTETKLAAIVHDLAARLSARSTRGGLLPRP